MTAKRDAHKDKVTKDKKPRKPAARPTKLAGGSKAPAPPKDDATHRDYAKSTRMVDRAVKKSPGPS